MPLDNVTLEIELVKQARAIMRTYTNGNKAMARAMFAQVPPDRKAFITYVMCVDSMESGSVKAGDYLLTFVRSVTN